MGTHTSFKPLNVKRAGIKSSEVLIAPVSPMRAMRPRISERVQQFKY
jgi:hypothetical protein